MDFVIADNCFNNYKQICFIKYRHCLLVYKNPFLEIHPYTGGGNISQLVYLTPHPRFWNSDCLQIMKWLWSITLLKMMKISYKPNIFCLFTLISHLKYFRWGVGGNLSQLVYLTPTQIFKLWLAMESELLLIALTTINRYVWQNTEGCDLDLWPSYMVLTRDISSCHDGHFCQIIFKFQQAWWSYRSDMNLECTN